MLQNLGIIFGLTALAALIGMLIGFAIGLIRKQWKVLIYCSVTFAIAFVLLIVAAAIDGAFSENEGSSTSTQASRPSATVKPRPTSTFVPARPTSTPIPTFEDLKANAGIIEYKELFRNNEQYESENFYFEGEVVQVIERREDEYDFRIRVGKVLDDEIIYLSDYRGQRLLEDDSVEFVGRSKGLHSYEAVLGNRVTLPELEALAVKLATNEPTEGSGPILAGKSRDNPIPFGEPGVTDDGLTLSVMDVIEDADQMILEENQYNDPPSDGHQFVMVKIRVKNDGTEVQSYPSSGLKVVGQSNLEYDSYRCGRIPEAFDGGRNIFEGGELSGNVCFSVESSDVDSLVMYDSNAYNSSDWVFFALK